MPNYFSNNLFPYVNFNGSSCLYIDFNETISNMTLFLLLKNEFNNREINQDILTGFISNNNINQTSFYQEHNDNIYQIIVFKDLGSHVFKPHKEINNVDVLIVAGGGGGGESGNDTGGGGAGGLVFRPNLTINNSSPILIHVGKGGNSRQNGENSSFSDLIAIGGGYGGDRNRETDTGGVGGSGGGGGNHNLNSYGGLGIQRDQPGNSGQPFGYGNDGGSSINNFGVESSGGGGAGSPGLNASINSPGQSGFGGDGLNQVIIMDQI